MDEYAGKPIKMFAQEIEIHVFYFYEPLPL
jgi:hypothetical protein